MSKSQSPISRSRPPRQRVVALGCYVFAVMLLFAAVSKIDYPIPLYTTLTERFGMSEPGASVFGPALIGYEMLLAGLLLLTATRTVALWLLVGTLAAFLTVSVSLTLGDEPASCGCFGRVSLAAVLGIDESARAYWDIARNAASLTAATALLWVRIRDDRYATA